MNETLPLKLQAALLLFNQADNEEEHQAAIEAENLKFISDLTWRKLMRSGEIYRGNIESEVEILSAAVMKSLSKMNHIEEELKKEEAVLQHLLDSLHTAKMSEDLEFERTFERIEQKLRTFVGRVECMPHVRAGRPKKHFKRTHKLRYTDKQLRDMLLVMELRHRKDNNPNKPIISETNQEDTHANDLAKELAEILPHGDSRGVGYETIKDAWMNRDII